MASGDAVVQVLYIMPPAANAARPSFRAGGSTPAERFPTWLFSPSAIEYLDFLCQLRGYDGGGLTFSQRLTTVATSGNVIMGGAIRRINASSEDIDTSQTYDYNDVTATAVPGTSGQVLFLSNTFTNGADMDSLADGEMFVYRVRRNATDAGDTVNSNDMELLGWDGRET